MTWTCARCHQRLSKPPTVVQGVGYGPVCAVVMGARVGDLLSQPAKRKRRSAHASTRTRRSRRADPQIELFFDNLPAEPASLP
jgi:hypothetical protein